MKVIPVAPDGTATCTKCGAHDFTVKRTAKGFLSRGLLLAPKRVICNACGTAHMMRERGPYSGKR